jgi:hypothetical protein
MRILKVGLGEVAFGADPGSAAELSRQRVNAVMEQLADIVFEQPPAIALSAMVSLLATQLSVHPEALVKTEAIGAVLGTLVEMNMNREEAVSIYIL